VRNFQKKLGEFGEVRKLVPNQPKEKKKLLPLKQ